MPAPRALPARRNPVAKLLNVRSGNAGCAVQLSCVSRMVPSKKGYVRREKHSGRGRED